MCHKSHTYTNSHSHNHFTALACDVAAHEREMLPESAYRPDQVEQLLQAGSTADAVAVGWFGDEWTYRLVQNAGGGTLPTFGVAVALGIDLGLDLSNDDGVATVSAVSATGAAGLDGRLRTGDVVRAVNGQTLYTCEAVVQAIKRAKGSPLIIVAVRPPRTQCWREDQVTLAAGAQRAVPFEVTEPACLTFRFVVRAFDVGFYVVRLGSKSEGLSRRHQVTLFEQRELKGSGHLLLSQPGRYIATFDNTFSMLRSKTLRFLLRLVPLSAWEAGSRDERIAQLESDCTSCKARSKELGTELSAAEARVLELEKQLTETKAAVERLTVEREDNKNRWRAAKAERDSLIQQRDARPT